jgi:hypothetical protein
MKITAAQLRRIIKEEASTVGTLHHVANAIESLEQALRGAPAALAAKIRAAMEPLAGVVDEDSDVPGERLSDVMRDNFLESKSRTRR